MESKDAAPTSHVAESPSPANDKINNDLQILRSSRSVYLNIDLLVGLSIHSDDHVPQSPYEEEVKSICSAIVQRSDSETLLHEQMSFVTKVCYLLHNEKDC